MNSSPMRENYCNSPLLHEERSKTLVVRCPEALLGHAGAGAWGGCRAGPVLWPEAAGGTRSGRPMQLRLQHAGGQPAISALQMHVLPLLSLSSLGSARKKPPVTKSPLGILFAAQGTPTSSRDTGPWALQRSHRAGHRGRPSPRTTRWARVRLGAPRKH